MDILPQGLRQVFLHLDKLDKLDLFKGIDLVESDGTNQFLRIGRIPAGTPINLIANIDPDRDGGNSRGCLSRSRRPSPRLR